MIKQVIVVRKDLNMRRGKESAQISHASMKVFFNRMYACNKVREGTDYACDFTKEMIEWKEGLFAKIVVSVNSEEELLSIYEQALESHIICALIQDSGLTEFKQECPECGNLSGHSYMMKYGLDGKCKVCNGTRKVNKPTYTCCAIGPDESEKIDLITKHLTLR